MFSITAGWLGHRTAQVGSDPRRFPVQLLAQSRFSYAIRPVCLEVLPAESCKPTKMETVQPPWAAIPRWKSNSLISTLKLFSFNLCLLALVLLPSNTWKNLAPSPWWSSTSHCRHREIAVRPAWSWLFPQVNVLWSLSFSSWGKCFSPDCSGGHPLCSLEYAGYLSCTGGSRTRHST